MNYQDTIACVQDLLQLDYPNYEILIRDNASPNASYSILKKEFPDLKIFSSKENNGYAAGHLENYKDAQKLDFDLFWILNSDIQVFSGALTELVNAYQKYGANIYGSVSLKPENADIIDFGGTPHTEQSDRKLKYNSWKGKPYHTLKEQYTDVYEVKVVEGSSMMIPKKIIDKYGFMETDFFMYAEEADYCYGMKERGIKSYVVINSLITHKNFGSLEGGEKLKIISAYYRRRNSLRLMHKYFGMSRWEILGYKGNIISNIKTIIKGLFVKEKDISYYYALGCWHAFLNKKGKVVKPEKLLI